MEKLFPLVDNVIKNRHLSKIIMEYINIYEFEIILNDNQEFIDVFCNDLYLDKCKRVITAEKLNKFEFKIIIKNNSLCAKLCSGNLEYVYNFSDYEINYMNIFTSIEIEIFNSTWIDRYDEEEDLNDKLKYNGIYQFLKYINQFCVINSDGNEVMLDNKKILNDDIILLTYN